MSPEMISALRRCQRDRNSCLSFLLTSTSCDAVYTFVAITTVKNVACLDISVDNVQPYFFVKKGKAFRNTNADFFPSSPIKLYPTLSVAPAGKKQFIRLEMTSHRE